MPPFRLARLAMVCASTLFFAGCSVWGGLEEKLDKTAVASTEQTQTASTEPKEGEIDVRRYLGPDYCPELRVVDGAEMMRQYEQRGHADDPKFVIWQASVGKTARECLWDLQGGLTLKIGVSGRVIAGPKGGAATVSVPVKVAIVKFRESVLATETFAFDAAIPATGSAVFTQVKDILVPSPGRDRDYIIYVGLDVGDWDPMTGELAIAAVEEPPPTPELEPEPQPAAAPAKPKAPDVLPTPTEGFVLQ